MRPIRQPHDAVAGLCAVRFRHGREDYTPRRRFAFFFPAQLSILCPWLLLPSGVANPPSNALMLWDGECRFCGRWIKRWRAVTGEDYLPFQDTTVAARFPEIPREEFEQAVQLVLPDGSVCAGAEAVLRALAAARRERWLLWLYRKLPVFSILAETLYHEVAANREFLSRVDRALYGERDELPQYIRVRYIFLRGLALIYLIAFVSLSTQVQGLIGSHGIAPAAERMSAVKTAFARQGVGFDKFREFPTLAWFSASDAALNGACRAGIVLSVLLLFGIAPAPILFLLWLVYLSLAGIGAPFLDFQWDFLLLETGFSGHVSRRSAPETLRAPLGRHAALSRRDLAPALVDLPSHVRVRRGQTHQRRLLLVGPKRP